MERFDKNGNPVAYVGSVNNGALTNLDFQPDVAMGDDGNVVVTWSETNDPEYLINQSGLATVYVRGFNSQSVPLWNEMAVGGGGYSTVSMDGQDNFIVAWDVAEDSNVGLTPSTGFVAQAFMPTSGSLKIPVCRARRSRIQSPRRPKPKR